MFSLAYAMGQAQQSGTGQESANPLISLIPMVLIFGIFYFILIMPQQKRQKEHEKKIKELKKNDEIITTGGIHGTIVNVKDNTFMLRVDDNVKLEISKSAVSVIKRKAQGE